MEPLLEHLPTAACLVDTKFRLQYGNAIFSAETGQPADGLPGLLLEDVIEPDVFASIGPHLRRALDGEPATLSARYPAGDTGHRALEISVVPYRTVSGRLAGALIFSRDVTHKAQLLATERQLQDYLSALDAHAIVAITDVDGLIISANDKFCEISQYSRHELYGRTHRVVKSGHHPRKFYDQLWRTISAGQVWQGEICNRARDGSHYWVYSTIVPFLGSDGQPAKYISIRADITKLKHVEQQAQHLALYDPLTDLPNRRLFQDRLGQIMAGSARSGQYCALVSIDLDEFKQVNDNNGHSRGDLMLRKAARRLMQSVRESDTVARMGGDEFLLILSELGADIAAATRHATDVSTNIRAALSQPYRLDQVEDVVDSGVISTPSIGVVLFQGKAVSAEELLQRADIAMYCAKTSGRNRVVFFDTSQQEQVNERYVIETDLRTAVAQRELRLYYQPIVNAAKQVVGMEALVRWSHPARGVVAPGDFIPVAEQSGLVIVVGYWVIETACAQLAEWQKDAATAHWTLGVNVSARQFNDPYFVEQILALLRRSGARPDRLFIELTETVLLNSSDHELLDKIQALKSQGVLFALDDFGTGYSSLNYLKNLPLDRLKIDRSFVQTALDNPRDQIITEAILSMAASLKLEVVAEGVETQAQFDYLRANGCTAFQGYLFGRPEPLAR